MGKKNAEAIRNMTREEIEHKLRTLREQLFKLRFERKAGRVEKPHKIKETRLEIARCFTILKEKQNAAKQ